MELARVYRGWGFYRNHLSMNLVLSPTFMHSGIEGNIFAYSESPAIQDSIVGPALKPSRETEDVGGITVPRASYVLKVANRGMGLAEFPSSKYERGRFGLIFLRPKMSGGASLETTPGYRISLL